jgi:mannose-6-phosphate isomerase-like protein (cupin superfamily)
MKRRSLFEAAAFFAASRWLNAGSLEQGAQAGFKVALDEDRLGKQRAIGFNSTTFKVAANDTAGALFVMEQHSLRPGGPPLHLHHSQDEFWYVVSGDYVFQVGRERFEAHAGDCLLGPRGIQHAYAFVGSSSGRLLIAYAPAGRMQEYFERPRTPGTYVSDAALYHEYGMELLGPPLTAK